MKAPDHRIRDPVRRTTSSKWCNNHLICVFTTNIIEIVLVFDGNIYRTRIESEGNMYVFHEWSIINMISLIMLDCWYLSYYFLLSFPDDSQLEAMWAMTYRCSGWFLPSLVFPRVPQFWHFGATSGSSRLKINPPADMINSRQLNLMIYLDVFPHISPLYSLRPTQVPIIIFQEFNTKMKAQFGSPG